MRKQIDNYWKDNRINLVIKTWFPKLNKGRCILKVSCSNFAIFIFYSTIIGILMVLNARDVGNVIQKLEQFQGCLAQQHQILLAI